MSTASRASELCLANSDFAIRPRNNSGAGLGVSSVNSGFVSEEPFCYRTTPVTPELSDSGMAGASVINCCYAARGIRISSTTTEKVDCPHSNLSDN